MLCGHRSADGAEVFLTNSSTKGNGTRPASVAGAQSLFSCQRPAVYGTLSPRKSSVAAVIFTDTPLRSKAAFPAITQARQIRRHTATRSGLLTVNLTLSTAVHRSF